MCNGRAQSFLLLGRAGRRKPPPASCFAPGLLLPYIPDNTLRVQKESRAETPCSAHHHGAYGLVLQRWPGKAQGMVCTGKRRRSFRTMANRRKGGSWRQLPLT
jgi:hypothetical protein